MERPIFVVGCPSSGNTLVYSILVSHPRISCGHETDFLPDFREIIDGKYWHKLEDYGFSKEYWCKQIADFFSSFKEDYAKKQGKERWADKTPSYTPHLDLILRLFPNCQIIHVIRNARDVVQSHNKRWGYTSAIKSVYRWNAYVTQARKFGQTLPNDQYFEVKYEDLVKAPEEATKNLFGFLDESWCPDVLRYDKSANFKHNGGYERFVESRRQESSENQNFIYRNRIGTGSQLDPLLKSIVYLKNRNLMAELGY